MEEQKYADVSGTFRSPPGSFSARIDTVDPDPPVKPPWYKRLKDSAFTKGMSMAAGKEFFEWVWPTIQQLFQQRRVRSKTVEFRGTYHHDPAPQYSVRLEVVKPPKPPWHKWFMDLNLTAALFALIEAIRAAIPEVIKWFIFGRKRQPAQVSPPSPIFLPLHRVSPTQIPETSK